jgi:hypothetical protein
MTRAIPSGIVLNHFFGAGSMIITIIYEIADVLCIICRGIRSHKGMKHPFSLKPKQKRMKIRMMGGTHAFIKTL